MYTTQVWRKVENPDESSGWGSYMGTLWSENVQKTSSGKHMKGVRALWQKLVKLLAKPD
jgi:hypothetical protein